MQFCVEKSAIGAKAHFFWNGSSFSWVDDVPGNTWVFKQTPDENDPWCLNTMFRTNDEVVNVEVPERFVLSMKLTMKKAYDFETVLWQYVLPRHEYSQVLSNLTQKIQQALARVETRYHKDVFFPASELFGSLEQATIDVNVFEDLFKQQENPSLKLMLESFRPDANGLAKKVVYDRFGSRTGRLTVTSGPEILTLKREWRCIVKSMWQGGKVFYVDYSALEARTFLSAVGEKIDAVDIYGDLKERLGTEARRETVKLAVLALLYGSGHEQIKSLLNMSQYKAAEFIKKIKDQFHVEETKERLRTEWKGSNGKIRNFYGRVVEVPEENLLINSYVQSTGVDVTLLGFLNMVKTIKERKLKIVPLFLLHDAILLDVHPRHFDDLSLVAESGSTIPGMTNKFFTTSSELSCT